MTEVENVWDNMFVEPRLPKCKKEMPADEYSKRYRLLDYEGLTKLSAVMETAVPIDGKGNFPSLQITPSKLVQTVQSLLKKASILVPSVRLNGSAATHVLSEDGNHTFQDLDLIFVVDLSEYNEPCPCHNYLTSEYSENSNNNSNSYCKTKGRKIHGRKNTPSRINGLVKPQESDFTAGKISATDMRIGSTVEGDDKGSVTSPVLIKNLVGDDDEVDIEDKESGYTSSGSSVSSLPNSPSGSWSYQNPVRSRTHSLDSSSSATSSSSVQHGASRHRSGQRKTEHHELCTRSKDSCWQKIKSVVMAILRELLPADVKTYRMTDAIVTDAYVQKMVKITNDVDRWSLISLNNNAGRNLELKFVEKMRRQYEFSVDSFQIILDSYQSFKVASRRLEKDQAIDLSPHFFPSVVAESVYGDIEAALRHLRHRRICTKRPEEIRGGGLLRYCNLRVRDFTPGEVEGYDNGNHETSHQEETMTSLADIQSYSTSKPEAVKKLEQLMCSRFFIDFSEFDRQQRKLQAYLKSHFQNEDDLKFQYLLVVGNVVDRGNVCLMSNERTKILNYIRRLAVDVLSSNVNSPPNSPIKAVVTSPSPDPASHTTSYYQPPNTYPQTHYEHSTSASRPVHLTNSQPYYTQYPAGSNTPTQTGYYYLPQLQYYQDPTYYPQCDRDGNYNQATRLPIAVCPCCQSRYISQGVNCPSTIEQSQGNTAASTATTHSAMSPDSPPFFPASKSGAAELNVKHMKVIYLGANDKLIYSAGPVEDINTVDSSDSSSDTLTES